MTWALWGKARARRDDELITLGETEIWVDFEFSLGEQRYRIWRQRSKRGRGQSDLHFYVWNPAADDWQLLDEGNLNERQAQIIRILRMDYDTFTNSAFLLQGRADSFTVKTAGERKQILADILGLDRYDRYEERAKEEARRRKDQVERIQGEVDGIDRELDRRTVYEAQLETARAKVQVAVESCRTADAEQARARQAVQSLEDKERQLQDLRNRLGRDERDLSDVRAQLGAAQARLSEFESVLAQRGEIEAGWSALQRARQQDAEWNTRLLAHTALQEQVNRVRLAIGQARSGLEAEQRQLSSHLQDLNRRIAVSEEQLAVLAQAQHALAHFGELQARRDVVNGELHAAAERLGTLKAENDRAKVEGQALKDKLAMLGVAETAACPLCGQPLNAAHRQEMLAALETEREQLAIRYRANGADMKALSERRTTLEAEDTELARELRARDARQHQAAQAEAAIADGSAAAEELVRLQDRLDQLAAKLRAEDYAPSEHAALVRLQSEVAQVAYDPDAHRAARAEVGQYQSFEVRYQRQLLAAIEGIDEVRERVQALEGQIARREAELAEDRGLVGRLEAALAELPALRAAFAGAESTLRKAQDEERQARQEEGAAMQQLNALATLASAARATRRRPGRAQRRDRRLQPAA